MLFGNRTPDGALYVTTIAPQPGDTFVGGIAYTADGVMRVTDGSDPQTYSNGVGVMNIGAVCIDPGGTIDHFQGGLPCTADGRLVVQLNQPVSPGDAFVGGIRVGPLGGIYIVDGAPPVPNGFSSGFSQGFGNGP